MNKDYAWRVVPKTSDGAPAPTVTLCVLDHGTHLGGTPIHIAGTNIRPNPVVWIGGRPALNPVRISALQVNCTTPPGTIGPTSVVILNEDGKDSGTSGNGRFTYT